MARNAFQFEDDSLDMEFDPDAADLDELDDDDDFAGLSSDIDNWGNSEYNEGVNYLYGLLR